MTGSRHARLTEMIKEEMSRLIDQEMKDPGISSMTSVTRVELSDDLGLARIYVSVLGSSEQQEAAMEALQRAHGYLRRQIGRRVQMREVPDLEFHYDRSIEDGSRVLKILSEISERKPGEPGNEL